MYEVGSAGRYAFFDAENIVAFLDFVEEIYDPKSGIIVAQGVGRVRFQHNTPENVKIITAKSFIGEEYTTLVSPKVLESLKITALLGRDHLRERIIKLANTMS